MWEALKALILIKIHTELTMTGPWLRIRTGSPVPL